MSIMIENISLSVNDNLLVSIPEWNIENGTMYGLCGETGIGKSTIGKWLANVEPVYWEVLQKNHPITDTAVPTSEITRQTDQINSKLPLYLLQDAYQIFNPHISIQTHFSDIWQNQSGQTDINHFDMVFTILTKIGINDPRLLMKRKVHQISQGEAQRLAFVLGLIRPASLRIYDEVFSNVDLKASRAMLAFLRKHCYHSNTPVIVISHETRLLTEFTDILYLIEEGKFKRLAPHKDDVLNSKEPVAYPPMLTLKKVIVPNFRSRNRSKKILCQLPEFSIGRLENVGLYGESGLGKTTFLRGLLGEHPLVWKELTISGKNGSMTKANLTNLDIRYLPQSVRSAFNPSYPLKTSISEITDVQQQDNKELLSLISQFGLHIKILEKYPDELSGGEIQRMGIISVLLGHPDLILLDESFSSVDQRTRDSIWNVLMNGQKKKTFSILVVSHDVTWLRKNMNRIYSLES